MSRKKYVVGNWKMNKSKQDVQTFFSEVKVAESEKVCSWLAPQFIHLDCAIDLASNTKLKIGAQDCCHEENGAFTGQVSPSSLKDLGAHFTIIGHSERRAMNGENNSLLRSKVIQALNQGLHVIYCVGETLEEREGDKTFQVIESQLTEGLKGISQTNLIIAYEPVWAIGTGKTATPEQAGVVHEFIRNTCSTKLHYESDNLPILYGGSVKPSNFKELLSVDDIDGGLVGGASLSPQDYSSLCEIAISAK